MVRSRFDLASQIASGLEGHSSLKKRVTHKGLLGSGSVRLSSISMALGTFASCRTGQSDHNSLQDHRSYSVVGQANSSPHLTSLTEYICPVMTRKPEEPDHFLGVPPHHTTITPTLPWPLILTRVHLMLFPLLTVTQLHRHYSSEEWAAQMACSSACPWAPRTETRIILDVADRPHTTEP